MSPRATTLLLLIASAAAPPEPETDPFLAAMAGKSGPEAVAAHQFEEEDAATSWTTRPRRVIVNGLAASLLRGEAEASFTKGWTGPVAPVVPGTAEKPRPPSGTDRFPPGFEAGEFTISDRLAARVPADAAAVFFGSLEEAETAVGELAKFLPKALPDIFADEPGGRRDALDRAVAELLVPTIWRSNPAVRRGTRQVALLAADPDLRWNPEIALVVEVDDASLVRFHRLSTLSFEDRGAHRLRVDGLDVVSDDGAVRSFFGLEGGIAVWSTGKNFRDRILAAAAGKAPTLLSPDPRAYALARAQFPAAAGESLLVVPDAFLDRANSFDIRSRRGAALRCDAVRLVRGARALAKTDAPLADGVRLDCPTGGTIRVAAGLFEATCSIHGTARHPVPLGDLKDGLLSVAVQEDDLVAAGAIPIAAAWRKGRLEVFVPRSSAGDATLHAIVPEGRRASSPGFEGWLAEGWLAARLNRILRAGIAQDGAVAAYESLFGELPASLPGLSLQWKDGRASWTGEQEGGVRIRIVPARKRSDVLTIDTKDPNPLDLYKEDPNADVLHLEWR